MSTILDRLVSHGLMGRVIVGTDLRALLEAMEIESSDETTPALEIGKLRVTAAGKPLGVFDLSLGSPISNVPFRLELEGGTPPTLFRLFVQLSAAQPAAPRFDFIERLPGHGLKAAVVRAEHGEEWLESAAGIVRISGAGCSLLVRGAEGEPASLTLTPALGGPEGIVALKLEPKAALLGNSGFGVELDELVFDSSATAKSPGTTLIDGRPEITPADSEVWRGIVARKARLFLPANVPLLGRHAVDAYLAIGSEPPGTDFRVATTVPARDGRPEIKVRIEYRDPTATGLGGFLPTLVEASMTLPLDGRNEPFRGGSIKLLAGKPLIARARFERRPGLSPPQVRLTLGLEAQGENRIVTIEADGGGVGERAAVGAGMLATAMIAQGVVDQEPAIGVLVAAAVAISAFLRQSGKVVLHQVELSVEGTALAPVDIIKLKIDYSVEALVDTFNVGVLSLSMNERQPLKVRVRDVILTLNTAEAGLDMVELDFDRATMEIEDPGGWIIDGPGSLFDVLGTRSGRGSMWIEVDLRFKLDLGPVRVSGATIRATLQPDNTLRAELRGLAASLSLPGVVSGKGEVDVQASGFKANLSVVVHPLGVSADAFVQLEGTMVVLGLGIDLPGPLPLGNSGLAIYGLGGAFAANGIPRIPAEPVGDIIGQQLAWNYRVHGFGEKPGSTTMGVEAVLGTAPDMGFSFSAKGGLFLTVPQVAIRVGLAGKVFAPRVRIADRPDDMAGFGPKFLGLVVIDPADAVTIGLVGSYEIPVLLDLKVPIGARFPTKNNLSHWFIYIGADGYPAEDRAAGPIRATVLPDIAGQHADAFVMMRGHGITAFGRGRQPVTVSNGFVLAFGFGFEIVFGVEGLIWAEVHASADILLATNPLLLAGFGQVGGSLNLGPISIGVDAQLEFRLEEAQDPYLFAQVCGHVDLFFFEIEGCVEIEFASPPVRTVPLPSEHPLERREGDAVLANVALIDHTYRKVADFATEPGSAATVWPDTLLHFAFATPPTLAAGIAPQFPALHGTYGSRARPIGSELLSYQWELTKFELRDVTGNETGAGDLVGGELSCAWLPGKTVDVDAAPEPAELVLLTPKGELWLSRLADAGQNLPHDPIDKLSEICSMAAAAQMGWTLGAHVTSNKSGFELRPEYLDPDPTVSQLRGIARPGCSLFGEGLLDAYSAQTLPSPILFEPYRILSLREPANLIREFSAVLVLGTITWPRAMEVQGVLLEATHTLTIALEDLLHDGVLCLIYETRDPGLRPLIRVDDGVENWQPIGEAPLVDGVTAIAFRSPSGAGRSGLTVTWPINVGLGFLGLGGITAAALAAAARRNEARQSKAEQLAKTKERGPPKSSDDTSSYWPTVLKPGRTYRVDVDLAWKGRLTVRDDQGTKTHIEASGAQYQPLATVGLRDCKRSYWFKTAKLKPALAGPDGLLRPIMADVPLFGSADRLAFKKTRVDLFHPAMIERYFLGYEPAQSEYNRFCDDALKAHFSADHIAALAHTYRFELKLGLQRTDVPGDEGKLNLLGVAIEALSAPHLLDGLDKRLADTAMTSRCALPSPGTTISTNKPLASRAWYDLFVLAKSEEDAVLDGRLPGVTFRTSRWRNPGEMIDAIEFRRSGLGTRSGDLEWRGNGSLSPEIAEDDDALFQATLAAFSFDGMASLDRSRISVVWTTSENAPPGWLCAGVLIEAPEPIHRPGRVHVVGLSASAPTVAFNLRRRDRSGAQLIFLTNAPFVPRPLFIEGQLVEPNLRLELKDLATGLPIIGRLRLPLQPSFAEEG